MKRRGRAIRSSAAASPTVTSWSPPLRVYVDPSYGPVLANYGIDGLRFTKPVKPGHRIKVRLAL
jgi:acyl dehydratase